MENQEQPVVSEVSSPPVQSSYEKVNWKKWIAMGVVVLALVGSGYVAYQKQIKSSSATACKDASDCPPANACTNGVCVPLTPIPTESSASAETANWKTYTNFGISFSYPKDWGQPVVNTFSTRIEIGFVNKFTIEKGIFYSQDLQRPYNFDEYIKNFTPAPPESSEDFSLNGWSGKKRIFTNEFGEETNIVLVNPKDLTDLLIISYVNSSSDNQTKNELEILSTFKFTDQPQTSDLTKIFSDLRAENKVSACPYYKNCYSDIFSDKARLEVAHKYNLINSNETTSSIYIGLSLGKSVVVSGIGTQYLENKNALNLKDDDWYWEVGACSTNNRIFVNAVTGETSPIHKFVYCGGVE